MNIPIVSLDKIYIEPDENNIFFLDCTRVSGSNKIISRKKESLNSQINRLSALLKGKKIIFPNGYDIIEENDTIVIIDNESNIQELNDILV